MSRTASAANAGGIAAELRDWARMPYNRGCGGVVDQGQGGSFVESGRRAADRRPRNHLARRTAPREYSGCRDLRRSPLHLHSSRRSQLASARRCGRSHGQLDPYHLGLVLAVLRMPAVAAASRHVISQKIPQGSACDARTAIAIDFEDHADHNDRPNLRMVVVPIRKLQLGWTTGAGLYRNRPRSAGRATCSRRLGSDITWIAY